MVYGVAGTDVFAHDLFGRSLPVHGRHHLQTLQQIMMQPYRQKLRGGLRRPGQACWRRQESQSATANAGFVTASAGVALPHAAKRRIDRRSPKLRQEEYGSLGTRDQLTVNSSGRKPCCSSHRSGANGLGLRLLSSSRHTEQHKQENH